MYRYNIDIDIFEYREQSTVFKFTDQQFIPHEGIFLSTSVVPTPDPKQ